MNTVTTLLGEIARHGIDLLLIIGQNLCGKNAGNPVQLFCDASLVSTALIRKEKIGIDQLLIVNK